MSSIVVSFFSVLCLLAWLLFAAAVVMFCILAATEAVRMGAQGLQRTRVFRGFGTPANAPRHASDGRILRSIGIRRG